MGHFDIPHGNYPETRTVDQRDDFHGTEVADPYRWLEDQNSPEVATWVRAQADLAEGYLRQLPGRDGLAKRLAELSELPTCTAPELRGGRWFRRTNDGRQQQAVLRVADAPLADGRVLIDPNPASPDGTTALAAAVPDPSGPAGRLVLPGRRARTGAPGGSAMSRPARIWPTSCRGASSSSRSGWVTPPAFVYAVYPPADEQDVYSSANVAPKLLLHRVGTGQDADRVLFHRPEEPGVSCWPAVDRDHGYLVGILDDSQADTRAVLIQDLNDPSDELHELVPASHAQWAVHRRRRARPDPADRPRRRAWPAGAGGPQDRRAQHAGRRAGGAAAAGRHRRRPAGHQLAGRRPLPGHRARLGRPAARHHRAARDWAQWTASAPATTARWCI